MRAFVLAALMCASVVAPPSWAQTAPTPPERVRLTGEEWACLQSRLPNLRSNPNNVVRVPLSPCNQGQVVRGPGNTTAGRANETGGRPRMRSTRAPDLTGPPLYLSKEQLACIERRLPELARTRGAAEVDLRQC